ncbi:hypothetical protein EMCRGX_G032796 [Ephydatia muelleri]
METKKIKQRMDLPRKVDGAMDWNTLGKMLAAELLGQVHCASYVDPLYGQKCDGFTPDTLWKYLGEEKGIVVMTRPTDDCELHSYLFRTVLDYPLETVAEFTSNFQHYPKWNDSLVDIRIVEVFGTCSETQQDLLVYRCHEPTWCIFKKKYDMMYYFHSSMHDGKMVRASVSIDHPMYPPRPDAIRAEIVAGSGIQLESFQGDPTRTLMTYVICLAVSNVPGLIVDAAVRSSCISLHLIKQCLQNGDHTHVSTNGHFGVIPDDRSSSGNHYEQSGALLDFISPPKGT